MEKWLVAGGILIIAIGIFIVAPLPPNGSWLHYWETGPDQWFTAILGIFTILLKVLVAG